MADNVCTIDTSELDELFNTLGDEQQRRDILLQSLKKGGEVLQSQTRESLKKHVPKADDKMERGVKMTVDKDYVTVIISILKEYRLKWFELGTAERYLKVRGTKANGRTYIKRDSTGARLKGAYRGKITPTHFFKEARDNDQPIEEAITNEFERLIKEIVK